MSDLKQGISYLYATVIEIKQYSGVVLGWQGGFEQSNPAFAYPTPNLTSLPMLDNMANIDLLQPQQAVKWPEFSWETEKGEAGLMKLIECLQDI